MSCEPHQHHGPCCRKSQPTCVHLDSLHVGSVSSFGASATFVASTNKPDNDDRGNCEMFIHKYVFRSELFDVSKPYITSASHKECQESNEKEDLVDDVKKEISISVNGKVITLKKFLFFYREHKCIIPVSRISCDLLIIKNSQ